MTGYEPATDARARAVTPLLTLITQQSMDEDYAHVARRRAATAAPTGTAAATSSSRASSGRPHRTAALVTAAFGVLVATAGVQTARGADEAQSSRAVLVDRVVERRDSLTALQDRILELREDVEVGEDVLAVATTNRLTVQGRLRRLQVGTGFIAVVGEGVRVTLSDAPDGGELVRDTDLQLLVNGLWQAGAEAISINGQRLTARTAIKNSDVVINVNSVPLRSPYVVSAIGDRRTLPADLLATDSGIGVANLVTTFGFGFEMDPVEELVLPASPPRTLRHAELLEDGAPRDPEEGTP